MKPGEMIQRYADGPRLLRQAVDGMSASELDAAPIAGLWSSRYVVCHIADFEIVYADRMKRVIAEREPSFFGGDPDVFAVGLAYAQRDVAEELQLVEAIRRQMVHILRSLGEADFGRIGHHNEAGPLSLAALLQSVTDHLRHHTRLIEDKRAALGAQR